MSKLFKHLRKVFKMKRNQINAVANFRKNVKMANFTELQNLLKEWLWPHGFNWKIDEVINDNRVKFRVIVFHHSDYYTSLYVDKVVSSDGFNFEMIGVKTLKYAGGRENEFNFVEQRSKNQIGNKQAWGIEINHNGKSGLLLVSYNTIIGFKPDRGGIVYLTRHARGYSHTTNRHISAFCGGCLQVHAD